MHSPSTFINVGELILFDITDIQDSQLVIKSIDLIRVGQNEGAFACVPDLSLETVLSYRRTMKMIASGLYRVYALIDSRMNLVGYIDFISRLGLAEILGVVVTPSHRRMGLGTFLLRAAERTLKEWGTSVIITHINENNEASKRFFSKNGYVYSGIREEYSDACGALRVEEVWWKYI